MAEPRDPFEYVSWCEGPSVDISPLVDFPLCTEIQYEQPTFALHHVDMTIPDLAPPPLCPCIWTFDTNSPGRININVTGIDPSAATGAITVWPDKGEEQDCCDPTFNINFSIDLPCIAFDVSITGTATGAAFALGASVDHENCALKLSYMLSMDFTCIAFSATVTHTAEWSGIGAFDFALREVPESCKLVLSYDISIPCIAFSGAVTGVNSGIGVFDFALRPVPESCKVIFSYDISVPCIGFSVENALGINIGDFGGGLVVSAENCKLKLSTDISLPVTTETVIVSVRLDETNGFQIYKKEVKIYQVVNDLGWSTVIGVGSCTS
jgi:hypothetical protein